MPNKKSNQRTLLLNNESVQYIPDTGAAISVVSEEVAKSLKLEIEPYDKTRVKAITAEGKEVKDIVGLTAVDAKH